MERPLTAERGACIEPTRDVGLAEVKEIGVKVHDPQYLASAYKAFLWCESACVGKEICSAIFCNV